VEAKGEESTKRMLAQMKQDPRAKGAESSRCMLGMLMGAQKETLLNREQAGRAHQGTRKTAENARCAGGISGKSFVENFILCMVGVCV